MDPFAVGQMQFAPKSGGKIEWDQINAYDMRLCKALGAKCSEMLTDIIARMPPGKAEAPSPVHAAADVALVHLRVGLDLDAMIAAPAEKMLQDYIKIATHIDRRNGTFPTDIGRELLFSRSFVQRLASKIFRS